MRTTHIHRGPGHRVTGNGGFTLPELMIVAAVSIAVVLSVVVAYVGTIRSWNGTIGLLEIQREASLGMEAIQNAVRPASDIAVAAGANGDSLEVYWAVVSGDSLTAEFYLDDAGNLIDINGATVASLIDSIDFVAAGRTLHVDAWFRSDIGTPNRPTDDQRVQISSTSICRN
jgi:type II secretory pathway pseudopilin PulG